MTLLLPFFIVAASGRAVNGQRANSTFNLSQEVSTAIHWRSIGPYRAGRSIAATGVPDQPNHFFFGGVDGGVWETWNAGRTWNPIFDSVHVGSIGAIAVAPSDPKIIYVGTGEADMRSDIAIGHGVYKSTDGGKTWHFIGLKDSQAIGKIVVDPQDPNIVWVAALGHPYGANAERGVFKSTDGGKTWSKSLFLDSNTGAIDIAINPNDPNNAFTAMWETRRPPWNVYPPSNGPESCLYETSDGGNTWQKVTGNGFPSQVGRIGITFAPSDSSIVYALVDGKKGGIYKSADGGKTWNHTSDDERVWQRGWYFGGITVSPNNPDNIYVCNTALYESLNSGKTFTPIKGAPGGDDYHQLWINPLHPNCQIVASDQGTVVSVDGDKTWSSWYNQPTAQIYQVATDNRVPYWVYGAQQDSGALGIPSQTGSIDGINLTNLVTVASGGESGMVAPDPLNLNYIFGGGVSRTDLRTNFTSSLDPTLAFPGLYRSTWTLPLVFSKANPRDLYYSHQQIFESSDHGDSWRIISPDLTRKSPETPPNLDPSTVQDTFVKDPQRGVVYAIEPSPINANVIWAGTDDGLLWVTQDSGKHWKSLPLPGISSWSKVTSISASYSDPGTAYIAVDRHRLDDDQPYIFKVTNFDSVKKIPTEGIKQNDFLNSILQDSVNPKLIFIGTESGVYASLNGGETWQNLDLDLPATSVRSMTEKHHDLVIATHGRGFYILDDISALQQWPNKDISNSPAFFHPRDTYRLQYDGFRGTPMPKDEPRGENAPLGVYFDYLLPAGKHKATLTVFYNHKEVFKVSSKESSNERQRRFNSFFAETSAEWARKPVFFTANEGLNRYVWSMRDENGTLVPIGSYAATLVVDGKAQSVTFNIIPANADSISSQAAKAKYEFEGKVRELSEKAGSYLMKLEKMRRDLLKSDSADAKLLTAKIDLFLDRPAPSDPDNSVGMPQTNAFSLNNLSGRIEGLFSTLQSSESAVTHYQRELFNNLTTELKKVIAQITPLLKTK